MYHKEILNDKTKFYMCSRVVPVFGSLSVHKVICFMCCFLQWYIVSRDFTQHEIRQVVWYSKQWCPDYICEYQRVRCVCIFMECCSNCVFLLQHVSYQSKCHSRRWGAMAWVVSITAVKDV